MFCIYFVFYILNISVYFIKAVYDCMLNVIFCSACIFFSFQNYVSGGSRGIFWGLLEPRLSTDYFIFMVNFEKSWVN